jgi:membrane protein implicated in regulation of membrane protease activity
MLVIISLVMWLLQQWGKISLWLALLFIGIWLLKDIVMYPFVKNAFKPQQQKNNRSLIGLKGVAEDDLAPLGYIRVGDELWKARAAKNGMQISKGDVVIVEREEGLTLLVRKVEDKNRSVES